MCPVHVSPSFYDREDSRVLPTAGYEMWAATLRDCLSNRSFKLSRLSVIEIEADGNAGQAVDGGACPRRSLTGWSGAALGRPNAWPLAPLGHSFRRPVACTDVGFQKSVFTDSPDRS